jgi:hypothetical protein
MREVFSAGLGSPALRQARMPAATDALLKYIRARKRKAWLIGEVVKGKGEARVV